MGSAHLTGRGILRHRVATQRHICNGVSYARVGEERSVALPASAPYGLSYDLESLELNGGEGEIGLQDQRLLVILVG